MMNDRLLNLIVKEVFNGVTSDEILSVESRTVNGVSYPYALKIGETELPIQDIMRLQSEAEMLRSFYLWELLLKRIQYVAQVKSLEKATSTEDINFGKALVFAVQTIKDTIETILKFKVEKIPSIASNEKEKISKGSKKG